MSNSTDGVVEVKVGDFSRTPYGRFKEDGEFNGERFRKEVLLKYFENPEVKKVVVYLDTVEEGYEYGSSFLEEVFGGLVRVHGLDRDLVEQKLDVRTKHRDYVLEIMDYISRA